MHYDQLDSPKAQPIVQECRGIILDELDNWNVRSFPYKRFYNFGEGCAANIDWTSAKIFSKVDGSIVTIYYYDNQWHAASKQLPDASGNINGLDLTFHDLFWKTFKKMGYQLPLATEFDATKYCFMFELMTDENRVIVPADPIDQLFVHGARNLETLEEVDPEVIANLFGWKCVPVYSFNSIEDVVASANKLSPNDAEGYVIRDQNFNRVKVKSPAYVALSQLGGDGFSERRLITIAQSNEGDEIFSYFPKFKDRYQVIKAAYDKALKETEEFYNSQDLTKTRKEIAQVFGKYKYSGVLFRMLDKKISSISEGFSQIPADTLEKFLFKA